MNDFKTDESGDLVIAGADLVVTESTFQHQGDIVLAHKGWWHHAASLGVGLQSFINEAGTAPGLVLAIRQELERDGMTVLQLDATEDGITIDAVYSAEL